MFQKQTEDHADRKACCAENRHEQGSARAFSRTENGAEQTAAVLMRHKRFKAMVDECAAA